MPATAFIRSASLLIGVPLLAAAAQAPEARWQRDLADLDQERSRLQAAYEARHLDEDTMDGTRQLLVHLHTLDQVLRKALYTPHEHGYGGTPDAEAFRKAWLTRLERQDAAHALRMKALLDRWGWFVRSRWGEETDRTAWLLIQHADQDPAFQKRALALLEPLVASGETDGRNYAYLFDRVAVNEGRPQRYGTQGYCVGPGQWRPRPMEDPEGVDARRRALGLEPLAAYVATFRGICREDESARAKP